MSWSGALAATSHSSDVYYEHDPAAAAGRRPQQLRRVRRARRPPHGRGHEPEVLPPNSPSLIKANNLLLVAEAAHKVLADRERRKRKQEATTAAAATAMNPPAHPRKILKKHPKKTEDKQNHCQPCDIVFRSRCNYLTHLREKHPVSDKEDISSRFICEKCGRKFMRKYNMKQHMLTHNMLAERPLRCPLCSATFNQKSNMRRHIKRRHEQPYSCRRCTARFKEETELIAHMSDAHVDDGGSASSSSSNSTPKWSGQMVYVCSCKATFLTRRDLVAHRNSECSQPRSASTPSGVRIKAEENKLPKTEHIDGTAVAVAAPMKPPIAVGGDHQQQQQQQQQLTLAQWQAYIDLLTLANSRSENQLSATAAEHASNAPPAPPATMAQGTLSAASGGITGNEPNAALVHLAMAQQLEAFQQKLSFLQAQAQAPHDPWPHVPIPSISSPAPPPSLSSGTPLPPPPADTANGGASTSLPPPPKVEPPIDGTHVAFPSPHIFDPLQLPAQMQLLAYSDLLRASLKLGGEHATSGMVHALPAFSGTTSGMLQVSPSFVEHAASVPSTPTASQVPSCHTPQPLRHARAASASRPPPLERPASFPQFAFPSASPAVPHADRRPVASKQNVSNKASDTQVFKAEHAAACLAQLSEKRCSSSPAGSAGMRTPGSRSTGSATFDPNLIQPPPGSPGQSHRAARSKSPDSILADETMKLCISPPSPR